MREFKFRGYHPNADDMVFFGLGEDEITAHSVAAGLNYKFYISHNYPIMQFTGLHDKYGAEIYEDDIIKETPNGHISRVVFEELQFCTSPEYEPKSLYELYGRSRVEVIGNIHQNPELL